MSELNNRIEQFDTSVVTDSVSSSQHTLSAELRNDLFNRAEQIIDSAIGRAALSINTEQVDSNFELGKLIVDNEQKGNARAEYGTSVIISLSDFLTSKYGRGYSKTNLKSFRKFYKVYSDEKGQKPSDLFGLSWSHYQLLMQVGDLDARKFYEVESKNLRWSVPQLKRELAAGTYTRLAISKNPREIAKLSTEGQTLAKPRDIIKQPIVLEFLGLESTVDYSETDLESAIITHLQKFLMELGKGFLFESRQKRFSYDGDDFFVDLVLYNRLLKCYVLIDLKIGKLKHADLGQMQMYVNYYDREVKSEFEQPTIGILLCQSKSNKVVEMTLPKAANIYAQDYSLYLPSKELLAQKLAEWTEEWEMQKSASNRSENEE